MTVTFTTRTALAYWVSEKEWVCPKHLPSVCYPSNMGRCCYHSCDSVRPKRVKVAEVNKKMPQIIKEKGKETCSFHACFETKRSKSLYCSDTCRVKNARYNYKERQKAKNK